MLRLSGLFQDHAVLQRNRPLNVWGWCDAFRVVNGTLDGVTVAARSDENGKFLLRFPAHEVSNIPLTLTVREMRSGESVTAEDLLFGDVWLAGGQSNMELQLKEMPEKFVEAREILTSKPVIRMITVLRSVEVAARFDIAGKWQLPTEETILEWSAAGFYFAAKLSKELQIPIGIVSSNLGGTIAEAWTSRETLLRNPELIPRLEKYDCMASLPDSLSNLIDRDFEEYKLTESFDQMLARQIPHEPENTGLKNHWNEPAFDDYSWHLATLPCFWAKMGIDYNGVVWFRRRISLPESWRGRDLILEIGAVDKHDITYFNGVEIGRTGSGLQTNCYGTVRSYRVPGKQTTETAAVIAVRNYSFVFDGGMTGPSTRMRIFPEGEEASSISLSGNWKYQVECNIGSINSLTCYGRGNPNSPSILFDNMIHPLLGLALRGVIYYQGESNANRQNCDYHRQMVDLIADWRYHFGAPELPFIQVILAGYLDPSSFELEAPWADIRYAQVRAAQETGNLCASALDVGDETNIHPHRKREVGERLAEAALVQEYGKDGNGSGPVFSRMTREGQNLRLFFRHCAGGLTGGNDGKPRGFYLSSDGKKFYPAEARIDHCTVLVSASELAAPKIVRYAWSGNPTDANLRNIEGLPASPFAADIP